MKRNQVFGLLGLCVLLSACGGGGGGGGGGTQSFTEQVREAVAASSDETQPFELTGAEAGDEGADDEPVSL